ncbi:hypothetical protein SAMN05216276_103525 [Streptosporangium subroseum]|uniref:CopC domain-containing protein n=1 Tax=Streptosporangium subroseum TaxID=106412 RepID=A0A239LT55_9ACTN|nr:hypothetical protein [Streptosporangium subroseum]SNT33857.1 hypothetical protein SAMN05216276_103525 [Streptosporangium subroseum]
MNKVLRYAAAILLAGLGLLLGAPAASAAPGSPIALEVAGDGGRNVNVLFTWKKDGRPVTDIVAATLFAKAPDGRTFGPIPLKSAPEGQNLYNAAEPLPAGEWKVTVTATKPTEARKSATVKAQDIVLPAAAAPASSTVRAAALAERAQEGSSDLPLKIGIIAVAVVAAIAIMFVLVRRRNVSG